MQMLAFCYPTVAVSTLYCIWLAYRRALVCRERILRDRVAFMLWTIANQISPSGLPSARPTADEGRWKKHSNHRGIRQAEALAAADFLAGRDRKKASPGADFQARPKASAAQP